MKFLLVLALFFASQFSQAVDLGRSSSGVRFSGQISFYEDVRGEYDFHVISSPKFSRNFTNLDITSSDLNFGFSKSTYWLRVPIQNSSTVSSAWVLEIPYLGLEMVELYGQNGVVGARGMGHDADIQPFFYRFQSFQISPTSNVEFYYLKVKSKDSISVPMVFWREDSFVRMIQSDTLIQGFYYGGILALFLYNLIIGLMLKDRGYLFYVSYLAMIGLGIFSGNGYGALFLWSESPDWNSISQSLFLGMGASFVFLFTRSFLDVPKRYPQLDVYFRFFIVLFFLSSTFLVVSIQFPLLKSWLIQLNLLSTLPAAIFLVPLTVHAWLKGQDSARYFLLGWLVLCFGVLIATLRAFGWIPTIPLSSYSVQISTAIEMLLFSFALAERVRFERKAIFAAQAETLNARQQLVDSLRVAESKLEQAVVSRTAQLKSSLEYQTKLHEQYIQFVSMISHEFRNPLNSIELQTALILKEGESGIGKLANRMKTISNSVHKVAMLFDKWLQSDRLNSELDALHLTKIEVNFWLSSLVEDYQSYQTMHEIAFIPNDAELTLKVDEQLARLAVMNLLDNAIKYSPEKSLIKLSIVSKPGFVGIEVVDKGIGISSENIQKIFSEYFRVDHGSAIKGIGLGLPFVKRIMQLHDGIVEVTSELNDGSRFILWFPAQSRA